MSDFRWYERVFTSRVMLREDSNKPFWKEKFIDGLPNLFAHKIRTVLSNSNGIIDYDTLTYGDIISITKQEGLKMCIEQRIAKQQMGNFYEQYGILPIAPSQRSHIKHRNENFGRKVKALNQMSVITKVKKLLKNQTSIIKNMITRNLIKRK